VRQSQAAATPPAITVLERLRADLAAGRIKAYRAVYPVDPPHEPHTSAFDDKGTDDE